MDEIYNEFKLYIESKPEGIEDAKGFAISYKGRVVNYIDEVPKHHIKIPISILKQYAKTDDPESLSSKTIHQIFKQSNQSIVKKVQHFFQNRVQVKQKFMKKQAKREMNHLVDKFKAYLDDAITNEDSNPEDFLIRTLSFLKESRSYPDQLYKHEDFFLTLNFLIQEQMPIIQEKLEEALQSKLPDNKQPYRISQLMDNILMDLDEPIGNHDAIMKLIWTEALIEAIDDAEIPLNSKGCLFSVATEETQEQSPFGYSISAHGYTDSQKKQSIIAQNRNIQSCDILFTNAYQIYKSTNEVNTSAVGIRLLKNKNPKKIKKSFQTPIHQLRDTIRNFVHRNAIGDSDDLRRVNDSKRNELKELGGEIIVFGQEKDHLLEGMYFDNPNANENSKTILICTGSNKSYEFYAKDRVKKLQDMGHHVLCFNYSGFGKSQGQASEKSIYNSSETAYQYLIQEKKCNDKNIVCWGYSLGSGPAAYLASKHPIDTVIDRGFASMTQVAVDNTAPLLKVPAAILTEIAAPFDNIPKLKKAKGRVLVVQGSNDKRMIKESHESKFKSAIKNKKGSVYKVVNSEHQDGDSPWYSTSSEFKEFINGPDDRNE